MIKLQLTLEQAKELSSYLYDEQIDSFDECLDYHLTESQAGLIQDLISSRNYNENLPIIIKEIQNCHSKQINDHLFMTVLKLDILIHQEEIKKSNVDLFEETLC